MEGSYSAYALWIGLGVVFGGGIGFLFSYYFHRKHQQALTDQLVQVKKDYVSLLKEQQQLSKQYLALKEREGETAMLLEENQKLKVTIDALQNENTLIRTRLTQERLALQEQSRFKRPKEEEKLLKEMLKYARDLSHPDKGGTNERFIRYNKTYNRYLKQQR